MTFQDAVFLLEGCLVLCLPGALRVSMRGVMRLCPSAHVRVCAYLCVCVGTSMHGFTHTSLLHSGTGPHM